MKPIRITDPERDAVAAGARALRDVASDLEIEERDDVDSQATAQHFRWLAARLDVLWERANTGLPILCSHCNAGHQAKPRPLGPSGWWHCTGHGPDDWERCVER